MNVGYMTNAWGICAGHAVGVPSIKDLFYISTGSIEEAVTTIAKAGFKRIEIFDGNLYAYMNRKNEFFDLLERNGVTLTAVYTAANFIYDEILEEEFYKINRAVEAAKIFGAKYMNIGGGALRHDGAREGDFEKLANGLNRAAKLSRENGLIPSFHHHLDTLVQTEAEIDRIMEHSDINLCVDTAHVYAAGSDPVSVVRKYIDRIRYLHLKDYDKDFALMGGGKIDFDEIFRILKPRLDEIELTIEANDIHMDLLELARHNYEFVKRYLD